MSTNEFARILLTWIKSFLSWIGIPRDRLNELDEIEMPDICVGCGKCSTHCPQNIDIPAVLKDLAKHLA